MNCSSRHQSFKDTSLHVVDFLMYRSYVAQREKWFNPNTCSKFIYNEMKMIYPLIEEFEEIYTTKGE